MANNIRELRQEALLTQPKLCELVDLPGFDVPLLSKIENDVCRPTPEAEIRLCKVLRVAPVELYGQWRQLPIKEVKEQRTHFMDVYDIPDDVQELIENLPRTHDNAIPRWLLAMNMGMGDRALRRLIEKARRLGILIGNGSDGKGYYLINDYEEAKAFYRQEQSRAINTLTTLEPLRRWLKHQEVLNLLP